MPTSGKCGASADCCPIPRVCPLPAPEPFQLHSPVDPKEWPLDVRLYLGRLNHYVYSSVNQQRDGNHYLFPNISRAGSFVVNKPMMQTTFDRVWNSILTDLGLAAAHPHGKFTSHCCWRGGAQY